MSDANATYLRRLVAWFSVDLLGKSLQWMSRQSC